MAERNDEIGDLIAMLRRITWLDADEDDETTVEVPVFVLRIIMEALERVPRRSRGNPRPIRGRAKVREYMVRVRLRQLVRERREQRDEQAIDALANVAKSADAAAIVLRATGRKLKPGSIERLIQGERSPRPRKNPDA